MKTSFIVVSWNVCEKTCACLKSLRTYMPEHEIVVVDNNSADDSCAQIKKYFPEVTLIENGDNRGFGRANNQGAAVATGDVFCFINNDTEVHDDGLLRLAEELMRDEKVGIIGPRIVFGDGRFQSSYARFPNVLDTVVMFGLELFSPVKSPFHYRKRYWGREFKSKRAVDWVSGCCLLVERCFFFELGQWDERYFAYCEDPALCRVVRARGRVVWYDPSVTITHHHGCGFGQCDWVFRVQNHIRSYSIFLFDDPDGTAASQFKHAIRACWHVVVAVAFLFKWGPRVKEKRDIVKELIRQIR